MAFLFPGSMLPWTPQRFFDADGFPLALGTLSSFEAGTSTPLPTYSDPDLAVGHENPVIITLGADGVAPDPIYLLPQLYKITVKDANGVVQNHYPFDSVGDVGQIFAENFGTYEYAGSKDVVSGYTTLATDRLVTVQSTGGDDPCVINLLPFAEMTRPITIKNMGNIDVLVTPNGSDTVDTQATFTIPGSASPTGNRAAITIDGDGISAGLITSSHGIPT